MLALVVPTNGNRVANMAREVRRLVLFERATEWFGGAHKLAAILDITRRSVNQKRVADRPVTDWQLKLIADAAEERARELAQLATDIRMVLQ